MSDFKPQRARLPVPGEPGIFGLYEGPIADTKTHEWDFNSKLFPRRRTERKAWIYLGVFSRDLYAGMAIVDAGYLSSAFSYVYIPSEKFFIEDRQTRPMGFATDFDATLNDTWRLGPYEILPTQNKIVFNMRGQFDLSATFTLRHNGLSTIAPSDSMRPFHFTYKEMAMAVDGEFIGQGRRQKFSGDFGILDYSKGYPPRRTEWNWLSMVGKAESGKSLAVNLVDKFNEGIENALWLDGKPMALSTAHFHYIRPAEKSIWRILTRDNVFEARFRPFGARSENLNAGLLRSQFVQPYGTFDGQVKIGEETEKFTGFGVTEDHLALW
ncbi:MAG TPA: DUF2804 domain-containing protein [Turneriella sp.]|nr:DUF2804 domain-containing protein [Turneriella sp.]HNA78040.1 DUF2804 domain-containing protein [Turneriella sp.]HNJ64482.1 DUF2804 domain-containing protein [Turneriella sp.]HNL10625.1 DUF2804 domain-containing protein [Turneriella sp.]HNL52884.1 DUF2804 domain-containing protein [Turneriella sp.]